MYHFAGSPSILPVACGSGTFGSHGLADVVSIVMLTGFLQTWVDSCFDAPPPALPMLWKLLFFPARYGLRLLRFDHPLGLGGPGDDVVWGL